jgi:hypothetical protein
LIPQLNNWNTLEFQLLSWGIKLCGLEVEEFEIDYEPNFLQDLKKEAKGLILQV